MKITVEVLDQGILVTAEDQGQTERAAFLGPVEALDAVARTLGIPQAAKTPVTPPRAAVAPSPEQRFSEEEVEEAEVHKIAAQVTQTPPPPATRRIGLSQPKKSLPPAGRRAGTGNA